MGPQISSESAPQDLLISVWMTSRVLIEGLAEATRIPVVESDKELSRSN